MRARILSVLLLVFSTAAFGNRAEAQFPVCGGTDWVPSTVGSPEIRVVITSFPQHSTPGLPCCECTDPVNNDRMPPWAAAFATEFEQYVAWVSNGRFTPNVEVVLRADPAKLGQNWRAANPSPYYRNNCATGGSPHYGHLNAELIQMIHSEYAANGNPNYWTNVSGVLFVNFESVWPHGGFIGVGNTGLRPWFNGAPYNFSASAGGATIMLGCWEIATPTVPQRVLRAAGHELGHTFGYHHDPSTAEGATTTDPNNPVVCGQPALNRQFVNMGLFSIMDSFFPTPLPDPGLTAYHPMHLGGIGTQFPGWVPVNQIAATPCGVQQVRIPHIRSAARGEIAKVTIPGTDQYYLLANHQGSGADAKYNGSGLLIWHIWPGRAWDLESAAGKTIAPPGQSPPPNPVSFWDALEANVCEMGSQADFFTGGGANFNPTTNPATGLYATYYQTYQWQGVRSGLHIDNIRYDIGGPEPTDMLADVSVEPGFTSFSGSDRYKPGDFVLVGWALCAQALPTVDILISDATGTNFTPLQTAVPNSGFFGYVIPAGATPGTGYRFRVVPNAAPAQAIESPPFTIWTISNITATVQGCGNNKKVKLTWTTSHPAKGMDYVAALPPGWALGQPYSYASVFSTGTQHQILLPIACQIGNWMFTVSSEYSPLGEGLAMSVVSSPNNPTLTFNVPHCNPCPPGCRPPCEFEQQGASPVIALEQPDVPEEPFLHASANPFARTTVVRFGLTRPSEAEVVVHDVLGRTVRTLTSGSLPAGRHEAKWDGLDDHGRNAPAGVYLVTLRSPDANLNLKLVRMP